MSHPGDSEISSRASRLVGNSLVCDVIVPWTQYGSAELRAQTLPRYRRSGFNFVSLSLASDKEGPEDLLHALGRVRREIAARPELRLIDTVADVRQARSNGQLAISLNVQGTNNLAGDLNLVAVYHRLGIRQMLLVYNARNRVGDGCHERIDSGLSRFGIELVAEMNRTGMLIDCSHAGNRTSLEAMEVSTQPVVFSHSNPRALWDHDRNITDEQALACARTGGVIGAVGVGIFMGEDDASTANYFRQIDHYCALVGPEHVCLGTDFVYDADDMQRYMRSVKSPEGGRYDEMTAFVQPEQLTGLVELMLRAGYADTSIAGILGENYLRVAAEVWPQ